MKTIKVVTFILLLILLVNVKISLANKLTNLGDISNESVKNLFIQQGDAYLFTYLGGEHAITIDKIHAKGVDVAIYPYKNASVFLTLKEETRAYIDLDRDQKDDIALRLMRYKVGENGNGLIRFAVLNNTLKSQIEENIVNESEDISISDVTGQAVTDNKEKTKDKNILLYGFIAVILLVVFAFYFKNKKKNHLPD